MSRQKQALEDMFSQPLNILCLRVTEVTGDWVNSIVFLFQARVKKYSLIEMGLYSEVKICAGIFISK